jgi:hypothetical protein
MRELPEFLSDVLVRRQFRESRSRRGQWCNVYDVRPVVVASAYAIRARENLPDGARTALEDSGGKLVRDGHELRGRNHAIDKSGIHGRIIGTS